MKDAEEFRLLWRVHLRGEPEAEGRAGEVLDQGDRALVEDLARGVLAGERLKEATDLVYLKPAAMELLVCLLRDRLAMSEEAQDPGI